MNMDGPKSSYPDISVDELVALHIADKFDAEFAELIAIQARELIKAGANEELVKIAIAALHELEDSFIGIETSALPNLNQMMDFQGIYFQTSGGLAESELADMIAEVTQTKAAQPADIDEEAQVNPREVVEYAIALSRSGQVESFLRNNSETDISTPLEALQYAIEHKRRIEDVESSGSVTVPNAATLSSDDRSGAPAAAIATPRPTTTLAKLEEVPAELRRQIGLPTSQLSAAIVKHHLSDADVELLAAASDGSVASTRAVLALYDGGHSPKEVALAVAVERVLSSESEVGSVVRIKELHAARPMTDSERDVFESDRGVVDMAIYQKFVKHFGLEEDSPGVEDDIAQALGWAVDEFGKGRNPNVEKALLEAVKVSKETGIYTIHQLRVRLAQSEADEDNADENS